jgi:glyoxylase-like metal-dependent hydrolase (beta-lactamase superfamily II)
MGYGWAPIVVIRLIGGENGTHKGQGICRANFAGLRCGYHRHPDHILGTNLFGEDALIIGNRGAYENMGEHDPAAVEAWINTWTWENQDDVREMMAAQVSPPEVVFDEELTLHLGGVEIWFFPLPGHLVEHMGVFVPGAGVLIAGDGLFNEHHPSWDRATSRFGSRA